jgi:hypothetical protein
MSLWILTFLAGTSAAQSVQCKVGTPAYERAAARVASLPDDDPFHIIFKNRRGNGQDNDGLAKTMRRNHVQQITVSWNFTWKKKTGFLRSVRKIYFLSTYHRFDTAVRGSKLRSEDFKKMKSLATSRTLSQDLKWLEDQIRSERGPRVVGNLTSTFFDEECLPEFESQMPEFSSRIW